jgi:hypothetical protein
MKKLLALLLALAMCLTLAACGDNDEEPTGENGTTAAAPATTPAEVNTTEDSSGQPVEPPSDCCEDCCSDCDGQDCICVCSCEDGECGECVQCLVLTLMMLGLACTCDEEKCVVDEDTYITTCAADCDCEVMDEYNALVVKDGVLEIIKALNDFANIS